MNNMAFWLSNSLFFDKSVITSFIFDSKLLYKEPFVVVLISKLEIAGYNLIWLRAVLSCTASIIRVPAFIVSSFWLFNLYIHDSPRPLCSQISVEYALYATKSTKNN